MSGRAPRVLVDATAVPADRGGVGRYVDGLIAALGVARGRLRRRLPASRRRAVRPDGIGRRRSCPDRPRSRTGRPGWPGSRPGCRWSPSRSTPTCCTRRTTRCRCGPGSRSSSPSTTRPSSPSRTCTRRSRARSSGRRSRPRCAGPPACIVPSKATRDELIRVLDADPTRIDVAYHGVDQTDLPRAERRRAGAGAGPARPARHAVRRLPRHAGAAQERADAGPRLGEGGAGPARAARAGAGRRVRLGRRDRRGHRRGAEPPAGAAAGLPAVRRPARVPRRRDRGRLPVARRGLRPAGARGDGLRRRRC